jgi:D-beta-D-heptose 7-phosphate kinase/D-beta-D-heptose 1-phosphate adenosyltransferase
MTEPLVIIGDALLDVDIDGRASRLTPDAPVPVLENLHERARPGGAGMAAQMAAREGHDVVLVCAIGDDPAGRRLEAMLPSVRIIRLPSEGSTAEKVRVRAGGQSLLRLDRGGGGEIGSIPFEVGQAVTDAGAVLVADYGGGVTAAPELRRLLSALPRSIPLIWDPHPRGCEPVAGARLVTPNESESQHFAALASISIPAGSSHLAATKCRADGLLRRWKAQSVAVTLGQMGALLSYGDGAPTVTPAPDVYCVDPCGAGDRFAVTAALSLRDGRVITEAVQDAVLAAADYVAAGGPQTLDGTATNNERPARASIDQVLALVSAQGGTVVATGGCFDLLHAGHVATLQSARQLGDYLIVLLNSDESVRRLKGPSRPVVPAIDRARVLEALEFVDAVVVFDDDTPVEAIRRIRPHVWAKGGDYAGTDVPEAAVLEEWGGQAVVLPYLKGRSTTKLVELMARRPAVKLDSDCHPNRNDREIAR